MTENSISELFKWWIYLLLVFGALALMIFLYQVGQTNRFASFVAAEIERGGVQVVGDVLVDDADDETFVQQVLGFTPEVESKIREENETYYDGRYEVSLVNEVNQDTVLEYGDLVNFTVTGDFKILFSWFKAPILNRQDQAIIQTRMAGSDGGRVFAQSMFEYDDYTYEDVDGVGILTGFSGSGQEKYETLKRDGLLDKFIVPDKNPKTNVIITHIANNAFNGYDFTGDFIAPNIKVIGEGAFKSSVGFNGAFNAPNVLEIKDRAFEGAKFTGDFVANNAKAIGNYTFKSSVFNGQFNSTAVESIGVDAFSNSLFTGSFNAPSVENVANNAFKNSKFEGYFNAPEIKTIGTNAFAKGEFLNGSIVGGEFKPAN